MYLSSKIQCCQLVAFVLLIVCCIYGNLVVIRIQWFYLWGKKIRFVQMNHLILSLVLYREQPLIWLRRPKKNLFCTWRIVHFNSTQTLFIGIPNVNKFWVPPFNFIISFVYCCTHGSTTKKNANNRTRKAQCSNHTTKGNYCTCMSANWLINRLIFLGSVDEKVYKFFLGLCKRIILRHIQIYDIFNYYDIYFLIK